MLAASAFCALLFSLLSETSPSTLKFIEFIWTRTKMKLAKRRQQKNQTFVAATFITPSILAKWNFDLWIVISGGFTTRFALLFRGEPRLFLQTLWRTSDTFRMKNCAMCRLWNSFVIASAAKNRTQRRTTRECVVVMFLFVSCFPSVPWEAQDEKISHATLNLSLTA